MIMFLAKAVIWISGFILIGKSVERQVCESAGEWDDPFLALFAYAILGILLLIIAVWI